MKITMCGSLSSTMTAHLQHEKKMQTCYEKLAFAGHTVYSIFAVPSRRDDGYTPEQKQMLDLLHLAKIEESDAIFVVDVHGDISESTKREILWAEIRGKRIYYYSDNTDLNDYGLLRCANKYATVVNTFPGVIPNVPL